MLVLSYIVFFTALFASFTLNFVHYMHMFQLNSYNPEEHFHWISQNTGDLVKRHFSAVIAMVVLLLLPKEQGMNMIIGGAVFLAGMIFSRPKKAKKKLVFTPRVIRMCVTSALIYGVVCALTMILGFGTVIPEIVFPLLHIYAVFMPLTANFINKPVEKGVNNHYINEAKEIINSLPQLNVIGITGSFGKTSTKFYLQKLLSAKYNVLMTPESYNTTMGVVKTVRGSLNATYDIFICEMGAKNVGEIKEICDIVKPKNSMITSIGEQHLESFKSIDNIIKTKFEIADCITDGYVFLNYDNEYIRNHKINKNVITYGIGKGKDYYADNISVSAKGTQFDLHTGDHTFTFNTKLIGTHNVENIVGAIAAANKMGVDLASLSMPIKHLECVPHRMQIIDRGSSVIIDDAFNSNPAGAKAALETLSIFEGYKILITPGMVELGEREFELNKIFGSQAADVCDYVILVGEKQSHALEAGLKEKNMPKEKYSIAKSFDEAMKTVGILKTTEKKIILLENDLPDNY